MERPCPHQHHQEKQSESGGAVSGRLGRLGVDAVTAEAVELEGIADRLQSRSRPFAVENPEEYLEAFRVERTIANAKAAAEVRAHRARKRKQREA